MKEKIHDLLVCLKLSLLIFIIPASIGILVGILSSRAHNGSIIINILTWIFNIGTWMASLGLLSCAVSFVKTDFMRELNYQEQWRKHFYKFNLMGVIFFICMFIYVYLIILDYVKYVIMIV